MFNNHDTNMSIKTDDNVYIQFGFIFSIATNYSLM